MINFVLWCTALSCYAMYCFVVWRHVMFLFEGAFYVITKKEAEFLIGYWIKRNIKKHSKYNLIREINWLIVNLSHEIFLSRGKRGHIIRQKIRQELWEFSNIELLKYGTKNKYTMRPPLYIILIERIKEFLNWGD